RPPDGLLGDQLDLKPGRATRGIAAAVRDLLEQPREADYVAAHERTGPRQLALVVVHVVHSRDDEKRLLSQPSPERTENRVCLGGVSRTGYERESQAIKRRKRSRRKSRPGKPASDRAKAAVVTGRRPRRRRSAAPDLQGLPPCLGSCRYGRTCRGAWSAPAR